MSKKEFSLLANDVDSKLLPISRLGEIVKNSPQDLAKTIIVEPDPDTNIRSHKNKSYLSHVKAALGCGAKLITYTQFVELAHQEKMATKTTPKQEEDEFEPENE